jgi:hypothetical protein
MPRTPRLGTKPPDHHRQTTAEAALDQVQGYARPRKPYPWIQSRVHAPDASAWHKATEPSPANNGGSGPGSSPGIRSHSTNRIPGFNPAPMPRTPRLGTRPPDHHQRTTAEAALDQVQGYAHIPQTVSLDLIQGPCPGRLGLAQGHRTVTSEQRRKRPWIKSRDAPAPANRIPGFNPGPMPRTPRLGTRPLDHHQRTTAEAALDQAQGYAHHPHHTLNPVTRPLAFSRFRATL